MFGRSSSMALYARWVAPAWSSCITPRSTSATEGSPPDLGHVLGRLDETGLVDQMALFLPPHGCLDHSTEMVVRRTRAQQLAERGLAQREQACAQAAFGGETDAVASG